jgi:hypothetical protein
MITATPLILQSWVEHPEGSTYEEEQARESRAIDSLNCRMEEYGITGKIVANHAGFETIQLMAGPKKLCKFNVRRVHFFCVQEDA